MDSNATILREMTPDQLENLVSGVIQKHVAELSKSFQPKQPEVYMTRAEVAELLKINMGTLNNWRKAGKLIPYGIGGRVYFKRHEIEALMQPLKSS